MMWIHATPAQRAAIVATAERRDEANRRTPEYQGWLAKEIEAAQQRLAAKQAEQAAGGNARRLARQIGEIVRELDEELLPNVRQLDGSPVDEFCNALRDYSAKRRAGL